MKKGFTAVLAVMMLMLTIAPLAMAGRGHGGVWGYSEDEYYGWGGPGGWHPGWGDWHPEWEGPHGRPGKPNHKQPKKERFTEGDYTEVTLTKSATLYENLGKEDSNIGTLSKGTKVRIMATYGDWQRVIYGKNWGRAAYIRTSETAYK